jgi:hypothetical protein
MVSILEQSCVLLIWLARKKLEKVELKDKIFKKLKKLICHSLVWGMLYIR